MKNQTTPKTATARKAQIAAEIQKSINTGIVWRLEGSAGRNAMNAIEDGLCILGTTRHRDPFGNVIPARTDVQEGTKGSISYAEERHGEAHIRALLKVDKITPAQAVSSIIQGITA
jgi:hypothetical protein